ncbi:hypothetical protein SLEP1_g59373 [Rubroshorea leprosula]|uniref:Uncharacterized protein n=1 Tax=Rubroshorea leprosula TaxID=152421 RepID=A0AAV5MS49_9ROSI|nr:hypothetical protein SLEP1_g59373 [Rubroshorea leprosula]
MPLCSPLLMELNYEKLQSLIETAWALNHKLNSEIENTISFCRFCSDHGRFCHVPEVPFQEREKLIAIRDSLKDVQNILLYIQRLWSWQEIDRRAALVRLEESRLFLLKAVARYRGRELDVVKEVNAFGWNMKQSAATEDSVRNKKRRISSFMVCCIGILVNPSNWMNAAGFAVKLFLISATLSSTIHFRHAKQGSRKIVTIMDSTESERRIDTLPTLSKSPLDVFCGRG